jgi:hypothetical protein
MFRGLSGYEPGRHGHGHDCPFRGPLSKYGCVDFGTPHVDRSLETSRDWMFRHRRTPTSVCGWRMFRRTLDSLDSDVEYDTTTSRVEVNGLSPRTLLYILRSVRSTRNKVVLQPPHLHRIHLVHRRGESLRRSPGARIDRGSCPRPFRSLYHERVALLLLGWIVYATCG